MAQIQKGTTYSTGDQVTATNLNALADAAILLPGAITDQTAKTVPLAADTVLIHSAADTALRKSTLTQLFANATGIPISTGISGLGTGIATALAINTGTTGAPALLGATGAFTTLSASGTAAVALSATRSNAGTVAQFTGPSQSAYIYTDTNGIYLGSDSAQNTSLYLNETSDTITAYTGGAVRATISSTGLAVTGALSATGNVTVGSGTSVGLSGINIANGASNYSFYTASDNTKQFIAGIDNTLSFGKMGMLSSHDLAIVTNNAARIYITSSGNVGIGTTSPLTKLAVSGGSITRIISANGTTASPVEDAVLTLATNAADRGTGMYWVNTFNDNSAQSIRFKTTSSANVTSTVMTLDATGNVGIGVTPSAWGTAYKVIELNTRGLSVGGGNDSGAISVNSYWNSGWKYTGTSTFKVSQYQQFDGAHTWYTAASGTAGNAITFTQAMTLDASGNLALGISSTTRRLDVIGGNTYDSGFNLIAQFRNPEYATTEKGILLGYAPSTNASIIASAYAGGTGALAFWTHNGSSWGERARIDSSGNFMVGTTSSYNGSAGTFYSSSSNSLWAVGTIGGNHPLVVQTTSGGAVNLVAFQVGAGTGTQVGQIYYASGVTVYATTSDYRRKSNVQDLTNSGTFIDALKPRTFDWDTGDKGVGFIAHEFAEVSPSSVSGEKDAVDEDGKPKYQSMQASSAEVIANLVAELKSLRQRVAALESN